MSFSEITIAGMDESRPPMVRKEPYIDLYFRLSEEPPSVWLNEFDRLVARMNPTVRINKLQGDIIETYVRDMVEIPAWLEVLKAKVAACNQHYTEQLRQEQLAEAARVDRLRGEEGPQGKLNKIIASLRFD